MFKLCKKPIKNATIVKCNKKLSESNLEEIYQGIAKNVRIESYELLEKEGKTILRVYYYDGSVEDYPESFLISIEAQFQSQIATIMNNMKKAVDNLETEYNKIQSEKKFNTGAIMVSYFLMFLAPFSKNTNVSIGLLDLGMILSIGSLLHSVTKAMPEQKRIISELQKYTLLAFYFKNKNLIEEYNHYVENIEDTQDELYQKIFRLSTLLNYSEEEISSCVKNYLIRKEIGVKLKLKLF